jgi:hypothetical protein
MRTSTFAAVCVAPGRSSGKTSATLAELALASALQEIRFIPF